MQDDDIDGMLVKLRDIRDLSDDCDVQGGLWRAIEIESSLRAYYWCCLFIGKQMLVAG